MRNILQYPVSAKEIKQILQSLSVQQEELIGSIEPFALSLVVEFLEQNSELFNRHLVEKHASLRSESKHRTAKKIYLCGPIAGCTDAECINWRQHIITMHGAENCIDPMQRDYRGREDDNVSEIVELDKLDIINSDVLLVNYSKPSVGTSMEILFAHERNKTIIVVCQESTGVSPWLRYHSHAIVHSFADALRIIENL